MYTVIEQPTFTKQAAKIWSEAELHEFIDWIAVNPLAGDVIPGSKAGARKVRWHVSGRGKRGGARVVLPLCGRWCLGFGDGLYEERA